MESRDVVGYCPSCGTASLFLGDGGYVTCMLSECAEPDAVSTLLEDRETEHIVVLRAKDFTTRHPLRERLRDELMDCELHGRIAALDGPPRKPGRYRVRTRGIEGWHWEQIGGDS